MTLTSDDLQNLMETSYEVYGLSESYDRFCYEIHVTETGIYVQVCGAGYWKFTENGWSENF